MTPFNQLPPDARVWIYQSGRQFTSAETGEINHLIEQFIDGWDSHGMKVTAYGAVYHNRFVVMMADENAVKTGGCSIDKSVHFIRELEQRYRVSLLNRSEVAYRKDNEIHTAPLNALPGLLEKGEISETTVIFNNLAGTKSAFEKEWEVPIGRSWVMRKELGVRS